jgi:arylsulfatase A-like enzyme
VSDNLTRRDLLGAAAAAALSGVVPGSATAQERVGSTGHRRGAAARPNVVFILADDLGYGDLSCYGRPDYRTPVLDRLAAEGLKFTSNYSAAPVCTPTRCAFVTGRYPQRLPVGLEEPLNRNSPDIGIPEGHPTIASLLRGGGYETALVGKWHLGWKQEFNPIRHGFDEFFGTLSGATDYFTHLAPDANRTGDGGPLLDLYENETPVEREGYLTELFSDRAVEYVSRRHAKPFYLSLHYTAPHSPWEGPADSAADHSQHGRGPMVDGGSRAQFAAMMKSLDDGIGRVLAALERARLERDTLVIFTSDNGGERYSYNWPFSGGKLDLFEGGTRVPAIARWPGVIAEGGITDQPVITMDWTATILAVAGVSPDARYPLDGESLLPTLRGERDQPERALFWRIRKQGAARMGRWKYLREGKIEHLFDLGADDAEKADFNAKRADVLADLRRRYDAWAAEMLPLT